MPASEIPFLKLTSATAEASRESCTGVAPVTVKFDPGRAWNAAVMRVSDQLSCAQAARVRSAKIAPSFSKTDRSNQAPSSVRVVVVVCAS